KDGLYYYCRKCNREHVRKYNRKNAARNPDEIAVPSEKRCPGCGVTRPSSEGHRDRTRLDGLAGYCKPCQLAKNRDRVRRWEKANPDRVRAKYHRRRARKANAFTVPHNHDDLLDYWRFIGVDPEKCWYCALEG